MARRFSALIAALLMPLGLAAAMTSDALAQGKSGGKVTGALEMFNDNNNNGTRRQFNVQEREGDPAKGWVRSEVLSGTNVGFFFAAEVACAIVNSGTAGQWDDLVDDHEALFAAEVTESVGHMGPGGGPPEYVLTFVHDGGEPSEAVDQMLDQFITSLEFEQFCAWVTNPLSGAPPVLGALFGSSTKTSIAGGNMQVHLD